MKKTVCCMLLAVLLVLPFAALAEGTVWQEGTTETFTASGGISAEQALQGYIDRAFGLSSGIVPRAEPRGSLLKGKEEKLYRYLVTEIQKVASGERTSTDIQIPCNQLLDSLSYTAEDLQVEAIIQDGAFTQEARDSFSKKIYIDADTVLDALLADLPYDLYWYNKAAGGGISYGWGSSYYISSSRVYFQDDAYYSVKFSVANDFSAPGATDAYTMNPALPAAIQTAKQNVEAIVEDYQTKSDIDKLTAYKKEICDRVEYNFPAAAGGIAYGNPWQLIWVFDDDPATTVVCEGYSKAFKYLCDLSKFQTKLTVSLMSGDMWVDDEEAGPHMWNLVAMGNGKNYLVDVTNCDGYSIGAPDLLFMKGYTVHPDSRTYGYDVGHGTMVYYYYDDGTLSLYSAEELAAHGEAFDNASYPAANLYGYTLTIPEDTVYIDSQAFADLGEPVNILIRRGDVTIADDAFSGSEVILIGPAELKTWADQQGIPFVLISDLPE